MSKLSYTYFVLSYCPNTSLASKRLLIFRSFWNQSEVTLKIKSINNASFSISLVQETLKANRSTFLFTASMNRWFWTDILELESKSVEKFPKTPILFPFMCNGLGTYWLSTTVTEIFKKAQLAVAKIRLHIIDWLFNGYS